ncbi:MAG TPA: Spy/CpxP family protein refolding chaperone, partial [Xanthobacteraceae bacterium]|nr:Spy/CpxP family protein refolding chaperone [Xanthobacteraceae bacterium]
AASCLNEIPLTAPGRLTAMETRLEAMRRAVETVRMPLEKFYGSLSDEQKAHFDAMKVGPEPQATRSASRNRRIVVSSAQVCRAQTLGYSSAFPEQEIEKSIQPTEAQKAALDELRAASTRGPDLLKDTCPTEMPSTPTGRLTAVQARLDAMLEAVKTERPAMDKFYNSLSDEQKARFNTLRPPQQPNRHQG